MKTVSLKLNDSIFNETENLLSMIKISRNKYINEAIDYYNKLKKRQALAEQLKKESHLVRDESMAVLKEFEVIEYVD